MISKEKVIFNRTIIILILMFLFLASFSISFPNSINPSPFMIDYSFNGSLYAVDGINSTDGTLNGITISDELVTSSAGWGFPSAKSSCKYDDAQPYIGSFSIRCFGSETQEARLRTGIITNTFNGSMGFSIYFDSSQINTNSRYFLGDSTGYFFGMFRDIAGDLDTEFICDGSGTQTCDTIKSIVLDTWINITLVYNVSDTNRYSFYNEELIDIQAYTATNDPRDLLIETTSGGKPGGAFIDDFYISDTWQRPTLFIPPPPTPEGINFINQTPNDITSTNVFATPYGRVDIYYNYSNASLLNERFINWTINTTSHRTCGFYENETCIYYFNTFLQRPNVSNFGNISFFNIEDNELYPATYNFNERLMELTQHNAYNLNGNSVYIKNRLYNISDNTTSNFLEVMANISTGINSLRVYYCNDNYVSGNIGASASCLQIGELATTAPYNHTHTQYSSHHLIPFPIDTNTGTIGGIPVTSTGYFLFRGRSGATNWNIWNIPNITRIDTTQTSSNSGLTWTNQPITIDSHLHQFDNDDTLFYQACGNYNGTINCSSFQIDTFDIDVLPPTPVQIIRPNSSDVFTNEIQINYTAAIPDPLAGITYYNISLLNSSLGFVKTIIENNSLNLSFKYDLNANPTPSGTYKISIIAYDNYTQKSESISSNFQITNNKIFNLTYSGFLNYSGKLYVRNLSFNLSYSCPALTTLERFIDGSVTKTYNLTCNDNTNSLNDTYIHSSEGNYSIAFLFNTSFNPADVVFSGNETFTSDLINPNITTLGFTIDVGGFVAPFTNITMSCTDSIMKDINYTLIFNTVTYFDSNLTNNTLLLNETSFTFGLNNLSGTCSDLFGETNATTSTTVYTATLILIDELENAPFDVSNISGARVYFDDNSSLFDFKDAGTNEVNFTTNNTDKLRFELTYASGAVITRYVDVSLLNSEIRVCANKEGIAHFEQLILSATNRPVILQNIFSKCLVAADYTRFAYQDALLLKAFTIESLYSLFTFDSTGQILLASVDGSIATFINIDVLEFTQTAYNLDIIGDVLTFEKSGATTITILYSNLNEDNTAIELTITNLDTNQMVFNTDQFTDPNSFTLFFDYSTLSNVTNTTMFQIELIKTGAFGESVLKRYFNTNAKTGLIHAGMAVIISLIIMFFGLTFTIARLTFSWFGIIICISAIAFLSFAVSEWFIIFFQALELIILVWIIIILNKQTFRTVT